VSVLKKAPKAASVLDLALERRRKAIRTLEKLFKEFGLDVRRESDWALLHGDLAFFFSRRRKPGRPTGSREWTPRRLIALALHWQKVLIERVGPERASLWEVYSKRPPITLKESVRLIRKRFPEEYKDVGERAISRELRNAKRYREKAEAHEHWWLEREQERERLERDLERLERDLELYGDDDPYHGRLEREIERKRERYRDLDGERDFS
jgi:hypothetical protein